MRVRKEVVQRDELRLRCALGGAVGQNTLTDNDIGIGGDGVHAGIGHGQVGALGLDAVVKLGGTHGAGTHAGIAGKDDLTDLAHVHGSRLRDFALGLCLHLVHLILGIGQALGVAGGGFQDDGGKDEGDTGGDDDTQQNGQDGITGSHGHISDDGTGGSGAGQTGTGHGVEQDRAEVAHDGSEDDNGVHQDIREVDLMDAAQQVDDDRTGCRLTGGIILAKEAVGQQNAQTGAGIGFQHIHDGAAGLGGLTCADGTEDAVVDGVVQEQHLGRLHEDGDQRQQAVGNEEVNTGGQHGKDGGHERADDIVAEDGQKQAQNADGEVVDEHLKTGGNMAFHLLVELLDDPTGEGTHDHGAHQHGVVGAADAAHNGDGGDDAAALSGDHLAALPCDEDGQQVGQHRGDHAGQLFVGEPARFNEQGGEEAPRDECADVRHDHTAEELAKAGNSVFHL